MKRNRGGFHHPSYSLIQAPAGMTVNDSGLIAWTPAAAGEEAVTVRVSDGKAYAEQSWAVSVAAADAQLDVAVDITPACSYPGGTVTIDVTPVGAIGSVTVDLLHNGTAVTPDSQGRYILTAGEAGIYQVDVTAGDEQNTAHSTAYYRVAAAGTDCDAPYVSLIGLDDNAVVTAPGDVTASVYDDDLGWWRLELLERGAPAGEVMILAEGTEPAAGSPLGTLDPTLLLNGQYELTLQAGDAAGRISSDSRVVSIEGDFKVGHFSITFEDLTVPVAGIPITITRTYDTRQRHKALDFGQGWSLGYQNVRIHENITRLRLEGGASPGHLLRSEPLRGLQQ